MPDPTSITCFGCTWRRKLHEDRVRIWIGTSLIVEAALVGCMLRKRQLVVERSERAQKLERLSLLKETPERSRLARDSERARAIACLRKPVLTDLWHRRVMFGSKLVVIVRRNPGRTARRPT